MLTLEVLALLAGIGAGCLGALLGVGGGVLFVPLLNAVLGLPFREAAGVSLVGVLATSASAAAGRSENELLNERLAIMLLIFSVLGATLSASVLDRLTDRQSYLIFGATAGIIAAMMLVRLDRRNVIRESGVDTGTLGGRFYDEDSGTEVAYRVRRLPIAFAVALGAGAIASFVGVGGGILIVPTLNSWCGVPIRVAAATSAFMVGVTAIPGLVAHFGGGHLHGFQLAAAAALGVLAGYQLGSWLAPRARVRGLKMLMAVLLGGIAIEYLFFKS